MNIININGYIRKKLGKKESKKLRSEGNVPCILYGKNYQIHFYSSMFSFKKIINTYKFYFINLVIDNNIYKCILQDMQFHPVSDIILHLDFLKVSDRKIKVKIPINLNGNSPVQGNGTINKKYENIEILSYPENIPEKIDININNLNFNHPIRIKNLKNLNYKILEDESLILVSIEKYRKVKKDSEEKDKKEEDKK